MRHNHHTPTLYPAILTTPRHRMPLTKMSKGLKNAFREKGFGLGHTYNGDFPNYQIDYIMASSLFEVKSYQIVEQKLSDHYPVRSDLFLK